MILFLEVITMFLASLAMSLAVAHALELPGKMRLSKENHIATQTIYYPGFTIGGVMGLSARFFCSWLDEVSFLV